MANRHRIFHARARRGPKTGILIAVVAACRPFPVLAETVSWTGLAGFSASWSTSSNWSAGHAPAAGDVALLTNTLGLSRSVSLDASTPTLASLTVETVGAGTFTLQNSSATFTAASGYVGYSGNGAVNQTGGLHTLTGGGQFILGYNAGSTGSYSLSTNSSPRLILKETPEYIGYSGTGVFTHTGGIHSFANGGSLHLGSNPGATGTYSLAGTGSLVASAIIESVGYSGTGHFIQSGGSNIASIVRVGEMPGSLGTYTLSAGSLSVNALAVGHSGTGTFTQTAGTLTTNSSTAGLYIGFNAGATGTYHLHGGTASMGRAYIGGTSTAPGGTGILNIGAGATLSTTTTFKIWDTPGTTVSLNGGTLSAGTFDLSGNPSRFSWTSGTLVATGSFESSIFGGQLALTPGRTLVVSSTLYATSSNPLVLDGGTLQVSSLGGYSKPGAFLWTSGTLRIGPSFGGLSLSDTNIGAKPIISPGQILDVPDTLYIPWSTSTLTLSGGVVATSSTRVSGKLNIISGTYFAGSEIIDGTVIQTGGTHSSSGTLAITSGTYQLSGGILSAGTLTLTSPTRLSWSAGTIAITRSPFSASTLGTSFLLGPNKQLTVSSTLTIPSGSTLTLDGGTLSAGTIDTTGNPGGLNWLSGRLAITGVSTLELNPYTIGSAVEVSAGKALSAQRLSSGDGDNLWIDGGDVLINNELDVDGGNVFLSAGTLSTRRTWLSYDFGGGGSTLIQTGGTHTVAEELAIGPTSPAGGAYILNGGTVQAAAVTVGSSLLTPNLLGVYGGTFTSTGILKADDAGSQIILNGGRISAASLNTSSNPARFSWTAGTLNITGPAGLTLDSNSLGTAVSLGSEQTLNVTSALTLPATASLTLTDTTARVGALSIPAGGKLTLADGARLLIDYTGPSPFDSIRALLATGLTTGTTGILAVNGAVAYAEASSLNLTSLAGQPVDTTSLLLLHTSFGDLNLDGLLTPDDYALFDRSVSQSLPATWVTGDVNYDNVVNTADLLLIDTAFAQAQGFSPGFLAQRQSQFGSDYVSQLLVSIPEPVSLTACGLALPLLKRRRTVE